MQDYHSFVVIDVVDEEHGEYFSIVKVSECENGPKQRECIKKEDAASPMTCLN